MKILNVSSLYPPNVVGGAEMGLKTISEAMVGAGHEVHVATLQPPGGTDFPVGPVAVHPVPLANVYWPFVTEAAPRPAAKRALWHGIDTANPVMARRVASIVREVRPDVVLTRNLQGFSTAVMPAIRKTGVPLVHVLHDFSLLCPKTTLYRNGRQCGYKSERCTGCRVLTAPRHNHVDAAHAVIGVSRAVLDLHRAHGLFAKRPSRVIYNALRPQIQVATGLADRDCATPFRFGYLGRVEASKGIETLLRAATLLHETGVDFRLRVAGRAEPQYLAELRERYPLPQVEYVGFVDAATFLRQLDTLVFPSEWAEALGNGVFEAFSQGVPVIGSNVGGIPESIDNGATGYVFEAGRYAQLARFMLRMTEGGQLRERMGRSALRKATEYLAANRAAEYIDFLGDIVRRRTRVA